MPNLRQSITTNHSTAIHVTVPGNITPIVVTMLSVQSKLSCTLVSALCTPPQTVHSDILTTRETHGTVSSWGRVMVTTSSGASCWHQMMSLGRTILELESRARPMLVPRQRTGRAAPLFTLLSLPGPEPGHTWPWRHDTDTGPTWIQTPGASTRI